MATGSIPSVPEPLQYEPGCSSPVNNASPVAVAATACLTAAYVIDLLVGTYSYNDEVIEVLRALVVSPFERVGTIRS